MPLLVAIYFLTWPFWLGLYMCQIVLYTSLIFCPANILHVITFQSFGIFTHAVNRDAALILNSGDWKRGQLGAQRKLNFCRRQRALKACISARWLVSNPCGWYAGRERNDLEVTAELAHHYWSVSHSPWRPNTRRYQGLLWSGKCGGLGTHWIPRLCQENVCPDESVSAFLFSYIWQTYLETAPFSPRSCHTANLTGQFFLPFSAFPIHSADPSVLPAPECGDCQGGGGHVSLTDVFDMLMQMCPLSTNACAVTSCRCQRWSLRFCTGGRSVFFHPVPFLILSKQTERWRFSLFSLLRSTLQTDNVIALDWFKNKEREWWLVLMRRERNNICLQCELSWPQTNVQ